MKKKITLVLAVVMLFTVFAFPLTGSAATVKKSKTVISKQKAQEIKGKKIVSKARTKLGKAYSHGSAGPSRFDCSGFVYWIYKNSGIKTKKKVIRTSSQGIYSRLKAYNIGRNIKKAKAGDIILFGRGGSKGSISHSAIYAGGGKMIHASSPRTGVIKTKVSYSYYGGKRIAAIIRVY